MKKLLGLYLLVSILLSACGGNRTRLKVGSTPEGEVVEAEGRCPVVPDVMSAKKCSLVEAQKSAVEKVVGVFVSARTRVEKAVAIEQNILAKTDGYVKKYDIVKEGPTKDNFYRTVIRALIPPQDVERDLNNLLKSAAVGNPRVAVMLDEVVDGDVTDRLRATQVLTEALLAKGFKVVDREVLAQANAMASLKAIESGDVSKVNNLAKVLQAEVLLVGSAQALFNTDKGLGGLASYRATVSVQAIKAATGEIVKSVTKTVSGVEANKEMAADKARENAARQVADGLVADLAQALSKKAGLTLILTGVGSFAQLADVQKAVKAVPGVEDVYTRSYESESATLDVDTTRTDVNEIAASLEKMSAVAIKVKEIYKDRLVAEMASK